MNGDDVVADVRVCTGARVRTGTRLALLASLAPLFLAACGGGGSAPAPAPAPAPVPAPTNYFPLETGGRWIYITSHREQTGPTASTVLQVDVNATAVVGGRTQVTTFETDLAGKVLATDVNASDAAGVTSFPPPDASAFATGVGPLDVLHMPASVGDSFVQIDKTVAVDQYDDAILHGVVDTIAFEACDVPAGHFPSALHVRTTLSEIMRDKFHGFDHPYTFVYDDWYVEGVGRVRRGYVVTDDLTRVVLESGSSWLQGYRAGSAHGGVAPAVTSVLPTTRASANTQVLAKFNVAMDAASLKAGGFRLADGAGHDVPSTVFTSLDGLQASIVPSTGWQSGTFTATVGAGALDRVGNAVAPRSWTFTMDAAAPVIVDATPADGAVGVPAAMPVVIDFSEPMLLDTSKNAGVILRDETLGVTLDSHAWSPYLRGAALTVAIRGGWKRGDTYTITFDAGLHDTAGNPVAAGTALHFTVQPPLFEASQAIVAGFGGQNVNSPTVVGDVDGDGIPDVVYATELWRPGSNDIVMQAGHGDGTFGPVRLLVSSADSICGFHELALGDFNGDGLQDVVAVRATGCGANSAVYYQSASGAFDGGTSSLGSNVEAIRVVDLDGDGRLDLVANNGSTGLGAWMQGPDGTLGAQAVRLGISIRGDFQFADMDGDGRVDLVSVDADGGLHVHYQSMAGTFSRSILVAAHAYSTGLALGDVNADGQPDIVATQGQGIGVFHQAADHSFDPAVYIAGVSSRGQPISAYSVALADLDGDHLLDVIVGDAIPGGTGMATFLQRSDGTLAADGYDLMMSYPPIGIHIPQLVDLNGDGLPDVFMSGWWLPHARPTQAALASTRASRALSAPSVIEPDRLARLRRR